MSFIINSFLFAAASSYDSDAQAFFDATGITDTTQKNAVNQLVLDLKSYSLWSKMPAIYPMVGGTATTHKFNLKDPRDLDVAFRLSFSGGWTHASTGALPNGTNGFADTYFNLNTESSVTLTSLAGSVYLRTNNANGSGDISAYGTVGSLLIGARYSGDRSIWRAMTQADDLSAVSSVTDARGLWCINTVASNAQSLYHQGISRFTSTRTTSASKYNFTVRLGAIMGTFTAYGNRELAFAHIGGGLDATENANLYTAVQAFQTSLSRNV